MTQVKAQDAHIVIDARGEKSPSPLARASVAAETLRVNQVLKVLATDPQSVPAFNAWVRSHPEYVMLRQEDLLGEDRRANYVFYVKRVSSQASR